MNQVMVIATPVHDPLYMMDTGMTGGVMLIGLALFLLLGLAIWHVHRRPK